MPFKISKEYINWCTKFQHEVQFDSNNQGLGAIFYNKCSVLFFEAECHGKISRSSTIIGVHEFSWWPYRFLLLYHPFAQTPSLCVSFISPFGFSVQFSFILIDLLTIDNICNKIVGEQTCTTIRIMIVSGKEVELITDPSLSETGGEHFSVKLIFPSFCQ